MRAAFPYFLISSVILKCIKIINKYYNLVHDIFLNDDDDDDNDSWYNSVSKEMEKGHITRV